MTGDACQIFCVTPPPPKKKSVSARAADQPALFLRGGALLALSPPAAEAAAAAVLEAAGGVAAEGEVATAFTLARILSNIPLSRNGGKTVQALERTTQDFENEAGPSYHQCLPVHGLHRPKQPAKGIVPNFT